MILCLLIADTFLFSKGFWSILVHIILQLKAGINFQSSSVQRMLLNHFWLHCSWSHRADCFTPRRSAGVNRCVHFSQSSLCITRETLLEKKIAFIASSSRQNFLANGTFVWPFIEVTWTVYRYNAFSSGNMREAAPRDGFNASRTQRKQSTFVQFSTLFLRGN